MLAHLLERIDDCALEQDQLALVIADEVSEQDNYRHDLWSYQRSGTWGYRSSKLIRIVDTIHFAPSSASRLVQAADLIAYMARRIGTHIETDERAKRANAALWERIRPKIYHNLVLVSVTLAPTARRPTALVGLRLTGVPSCWQGTRVGTCRPLSLVRFAYWYRERRRAWRRRDRYGRSGTLPDSGVPATGL